MPNLKVGRSNQGNIVNSYVKITKAATWALTGETVRGTKEERRRGDNDGCYVEIDFNIDNDNYRIIRSKDHKEYKTNEKSNCI